MEPILGQRRKRAKKLTAQDLQDTDSSAESDGRLDAALTDPRKLPSAMIEYVHSHVLRASCSLYNLAHQMPSSRCKLDLQWPRYFTCTRHSYPVLQAFSNPSSSQSGCVVIKSSTCDLNRPRCSRSTQAGCTPALFTPLSQMTRQRR